MPEFYCTFGYGHKPGIGYYRRVIAPDKMAARKVMFGEYGTKWCTSYLSADAAGVERWNLKEVKPPLVGHETEGQTTVVAVQPAPVDE